MNGSAGPPGSAAVGATGAASSTGAEGEATPAPGPGGERSRIGGAHLQHMRHLVSVFIGATALTMTAMTLPTILETAGDGSWPAACLLAPIVASAVVAAISSVVGLRLQGRASDEDDRERAPSRRSRVLRGCDRLSELALRGFLLTYLGAAIITAVAPVVPIVTEDPASPHTHPLIALYFVVTAATMVVSTPLRVGYLLVLAPILVLTLATALGDLRPVSFKEVAIGLSVNVAALGALTCALRQAEALDATSGQRRKQAVALAAERARSRAQRRSNRLIHDHILSALISVAAGLPDPQALRESAKDALDSITASTDEDADEHADEASGMLLVGLADRLRSLCRGGRAAGRVAGRAVGSAPVAGPATGATGSPVAAPRGQPGSVPVNVPVNMPVTVSVTRQWPVPGRVAHALVEAACEALRNSLRHAERHDHRPGRTGRRRAVRRWARLVSDDSGVSVHICDDGAGFDPGATGHGRLGLSGSVVGRLHEVGARAHVVSAVGRGTTIVLLWNPGGPPAAHPTGFEKESRAQRDPLAQNDAMAQRESRAWTRSLSHAMQSPAARAIGLGVAVVHILVAAHECASGAYRAWEPVALSLAALLGAGCLLLRSWPGALLPRWAATTVMITSAAGNLLVLEQVLTDGWPGYAAWSIGVGDVLCCGLVLRGRSAYAWAGMFLMILTVVHRVLSTDQSWSAVIAQMMGPCVMLGTWQAIAHLSTRATAQIAAAQRSASALLAHRRAQQEADEFMNQRMDSVRRRVAPLLTRIADGAVPTRPMQVEAGLLEAQLRDEIRAPFFTGTPVIDDAREARRRGIEVILLDDSGGAGALPAGLHREVLELVSSVLTCTMAGRVVVRVHPPGRSILLSIATETTTHYLRADGTGDAPPRRRTLGRAVVPWRYVIAP